MTETGTRTYEIVTTRGKQRITVPDTYKVTFGAVVPGAKGGGGSYGGWGLRIWESQDKQRAVFSDVISFRDLSIPVEIEAVRKFGSDNDWMIDDGSWTGKRAELVEKAWKSIDEVRKPEPEVATAEDDDDFVAKFNPPRARLSPAYPKRSS